jgi:hypothetical protein
MTVHLSRWVLQKYTQENHIIHCPILAFAQGKVVFSNHFNEKHQFQGLQGQIKCLPLSSRRVYISHNLLLCQPLSDF